MEAGPLVKGVSDAVHQSFPSEEEARCAFALALSKGHTRIVGDHRNANQHMSALSIPFSSGSTSSSSRPIENLSAKPSSTKTLSTCLSPRQQRPEAIGDHESPNSKKPGSSSNLRAVSYILSEPAHNSSHSTTSDRPYNNDKKLFEIVKTPVLTPQSDPTGLPPNLKRASRRPRAIVKTPSWLSSYPKSPLSPLDSEYLPLHNFRASALSNDGDEGMNLKPSPLTNLGSPSGSSMYCARTPRMSTISSKSNGSVSRSSICFLPPVRPAHVVHEQDKDPRSPMSRVPVSGFK